MSRRNACPVVAPAPLRRVWPTVGAAAAALGISRNALYAHLRYDPDAQWWRLEPEQQRIIALYRAIHVRERRPE